MDAAALIHDPSRVKAAFLSSGNMLIAKEELKIYIPVRYESKRMASIGSEIMIPGVFGVVVEGKYYSASLAMAMMRIEPDEIATVKFDEESYYEFTFHAGSVVSPETNLSKNEFTSYQFYDLFPSQGNIPWFIADQLSALFAESKYYTGLQVGSSGGVMEILIAAISRSPDDDNENYRHYINKNPDSKLAPVYIGTSNVVFNTNNTTAKIIGNYFDDSIASALYNPSDRTEGIESLLRK